MSGLFCVQLVSSPVLHLGCEPPSRPGLLVSVKPSACDSQPSFTTTNDQFIPLMTPDDGVPAQQVGFLVQHPLWLPLQSHRQSFVCSCTCTSVYVLVFLKFIYLNIDCSMLLTTLKWIHRLVVKKNAVLTNTSTPVPWKCFNLFKNIG